MRGIITIGTRDKDTSGSLNIVDKKNPQPDDIQVPNQDAAIIIKNASPLKSKCTTK